MTTPSVLFLFAVLFAVARTGFPIRCEVSPSTSTIGKWSTSLQTCDSESDACISVVLYRVMPGRKTERFVIKSCIRKESCFSGDIVAQLEDGSWVTGKSDCCITNGCNAGIPKVQPWNDAENGLICPICIPGNDHSEPCKLGSILCRGPADMCIRRTMAQSSYLGPTVYMGCATDAFCAIYGKIKAVLGPLEASVEWRTECTKAHKG